MGRAGLNVGLAQRIRRDEARATTSEEERKQLKGTRWQLLKSFWNLSLFDSLRLSQLQRENKRLYRAYLLKDSLVRILDCGSEWLARIKLDQWIRWARRSHPSSASLAPFATAPKASWLTFARASPTAGPRDSTARPAPSRVARTDSTAPPGSSHYSCFVAQESILTLSNSSLAPPTKPCGEPGVDHATRAVVQA
jgi:hypothetical protein